MIAKITATLAVSISLFACLRKQSEVQATSHEAETTTPGSPQLPDFMVGTWSCNSFYNPVDIWHDSIGPSTYTAVKLPNGRVRGTYHEERATGRDDFTDEWVIVPTNDGKFTLSYHMEAEDGSVAEAAGPLTLDPGTEGALDFAVGTVHFPDGSTTGWRPVGFAYDGPRFGSPLGLNMAWGFEVQISQIGPGFEEYFEMNCTRK